ncbi:MAG: hypothetical protein BWY82_02421 [Verrucomicrobia bacterium ADurb.Bin474]|nr:MAG: hypothetical protein BWY82_02421 [Verrucomicrobia bacterium ADurb.Bin474]
MNLFPVDLDVSAEGVSLFLFGEIIVSVEFGTGFFVENELEALLISGADTGDVVGQSIGAFFMLIQILVQGASITADPGSDQFETRQTIDNMADLLAGEPVVVPLAIKVHVFGP